MPTLPLLTDEMWPVIVEKVWGEGGKNGKSTTIDVAFLSWFQIGFCPYFETRTRVLRQKPGGFSLGW